MVKKAAPYSTIGPYCGVTKVLLNEHFLMSINDIIRINIKHPYLKVGVEMFFKKKKFYICSVCGYDRLPGPLYENGIPDVSLICACCGFQPGIDDNEFGYTFESYRNEWIEEGAQWFKEKERPSDWDLNEQLKNIPIS